jgi:Flp pilus assembly protein TadG
MASSGRNPLRRRLLSVLLAGGRHEGGVSAIEFAIIAPVFFLLLFAILETGILYLGQFDLQHAVNSASRLLRTGQAQTQNMTQAAFRQAVCDKLMMLSCSTSLQIDVESYGSFGTAAFGPPLNADGTVNTALANYQPGASGQVVLLRALYVWPIMTPGLKVFLSNMANGAHLIVVSAAFRNEPF